MRLKARKDENHNDIRDIFIAAGASVHDTSQLGKGFPDLVIGICGFNILVEVKDGDKVPSKQKLTEDEFKFFDRWKGWTAVVRNDQDALNIIKQAKQAKAHESFGFYCLMNHQEKKIPSLNDYGNNLPPEVKAEYEKELSETRDYYQEVKA
jgi:hypothetical protein